MILVPALLGRRDTGPQLPRAQKRPAAAVFSRAAGADSRASLPGGSPPVPDPPGQTPRASPTLSCAARSCGPLQLDLPSIQRTITKGVAGVLLASWQAMQEHLHRLGSPLPSRGGEGIIRKASRTSSTRQVSSRRRSSSCPHDAGAGPRPHVQTHAGENLFSVGHDLLLGRLPSATPAQAMDRRAFPRWPCRTNTP